LLPIYIVNNMTLSQRNKARDISERALNAIAQKYMTTNVIENILNNYSRCEERKKEVNRRKKRMMKKKRREEVEK
jgi:hypothetical protein